MNGFAGTLKRDTRWLVWVVIIFLIQIVIIVWLSDNAQPLVRKPARAPVLALAGPGCSELLALTDPTLFAVPHFRGFSGDAWLRLPPARERSFEWTDDPRWLTLAPQDIARPSPEPRPENLNAFEIVSAATPQRLSLLLSVPPQFPEKSSLRIQGLDRRKLLAPPDLPVWSSTNLLTNTVVTIMVDGEGLARSATLLVRSGLKEADDYALKTARALRFEPVATTQRLATPSNSTLSWSEIVFQWHGAPPGMTNK